MSDMKHSSISQCISRDRDWVRCTNDSVEGGNKCKYHLPEKVKEREQKARVSAQARAQARAQYELEQEQRERAEFRAQEQARVQARERRRLEMEQYVLVAQEERLRLEQEVVRSREERQRPLFYISGFFDSIRGYVQQPPQPPLRAGAGAIGYKPNMKTLRECECDICAEDNKRMIVLHCCRKEMCADCMKKITNAKCPFCKQDNNMIVE